MLIHFANKSMQTAKHKDYGRKKHARRLKLNTNETDLVSCLLLRTQVFMFFVKTMDSTLTAQFLQGQDLADVV